MTYEQFWFGPPNLVIAYRQAEKKRWENFNSKAWIQGAYISDALAVNLGNAFSKGKKKKYPEKPYDLFEKTEEEQAKETEKAKQKVIADLKAMAIRQRAEKQKALEKAMSEQKKVNEEING